MRSTSLSALILAFFAHRVFGGSYTISDNFQGTAFYDNFDFKTFDDPTEGYVNYVDKTTAQNNGLVSVSGSNLTLRADSTNVPGASARGRDSVRIESLKKWETHVSIYNVAHMPQGCGTWPALWEVGQSWEDDGEIDILEVPDYVTLHVGPDSPGGACTMPDSRPMTGSVNNNVCDHTDAADSGCSVGLAEGGLSYGTQFNANGGGFYAMEQTDEFIKVWFWARNNGAIPADVLSGSESINTDDWGTPSAYFPNTDCDIATHFNERNIVINLTFCGGYAGGEFNQDGCPGECNDYVQNNPSAFSNAYFELLWVKVYEP